MSHTKCTRSGRKEAGLPKCSLLLLMGGVLLALPGGLFTPGLAENAQSEVSLPVEHHPLGVLCPQVSRTVDFIAEDNSQSAVSRL